MGLLSLSLSLSSPTWLYAVPLSPLLHISLLIAHGSGDAVHILGQEQGLALSRDGALAQGGLGAAEQRVVAGQGEEGAAEQQGNNTIQ